jgi:hypothetical protein
MNKEMTPEEIAAKEKVEAVIQSCTTCEHFKFAEHYLELFNKQFKDEEAFDEMKSLMSQRKLDINCYDL